ncbi:Fur family transcriptional regulator [Phenylobacterium sp.]|uniref:Fur family transcriptional regulator n=1 Tax=Phenylobacterium sp. TaxID=1871053 RepID=UPI002F404C1F
MSLSCAHQAASKPTKAVMRTAMAAARARCLSAGQRWTAQRQRALELLLEAGGPIKAYELLARFKEGAQTAPPTVYRALDTLVSLGLAHRIASLNAYTACHLTDEGHSASFLICDCCGAAEEIATPAGGLLDAIRAQSDFQPSHITVEAHGRCRSCRT